MCADTMFSPLEILPQNAELTVCFLGRMFALYSNTRQNITETPISVYCFTDHDFSDFRVSRGIKLWPLPIICLIDCFDSLPECFIKVKFLPHHSARHR
jgi:hypothetical protein